MLGVVVVSYHSPERTAHFVRDELPKLPWAYRACVVDVAATNETKQYLAANLPQDTLRLEFAENLGYSRGNNRGAERLRQECPELEYLLFCNDDIEFTAPETLGVLMTALQADTARGIVGPDCRGVDNLPQSPWNSADDLGKTERWRRFSSPFGGPSRPCYAVRGCCLLVKASPFFAVGGFDESFFLFFEEPALGERFARHGLSTWYEAAAQVRHLGSATIRCSLSFWKIYRIYRQSFFLMARKYWNWGLIRCALWPATHQLARLSRLILR